MLGVLIVIVAVGGLLLLCGLQDWVTNANRKLYVENFDLNLTIAEREVTRTGNILYDWPSEENRTDWERAVAYRDALLRNAYHA